MLTPKMKRATASANERTQTKARKGLKLYVWYGVFADHTSGAAWALAYTVAQARKLITAKCPNSESARRELSGAPVVHRAPAGYVVYGGG